MPLPEDRIEAFAPRLGHLMQEFSRVHNNRQTLDPSDCVDKFTRGLSPDSLDEQYNIDAEARLTLKDALDYCVWELGKILGFEKTHRKYIDVRDLKLEEIVEIMLTRAPDLLKDQLVGLVREITNNHVVHTVVADVVGRYYGHDNNVSAIFDRSLADIAVVSNPALLTRPNDYSKYLSKDFFHSPVKKSRIAPGEESSRLPFPHDDTWSGQEGRGYKHHSMIFLPGTDLTRKTPSRLPVNDQTELWGQLLYKTKVNFTNLELDETRLIAVNGVLKTLVARNCIIIPGENLSMSGGEWVGGKLILEESSAAKFSAQFFFGTEIKVEGELNKAVVFSACDFSHAKLDEDSLRKLAGACDSSCVFSKDQLQILGPECSDNYCSEDAAINGIRNFAPDEENSQKDGFRKYGILGVGRAPNKMVNDRWNSKRTDLADVPILRQADQKRRDLKYFGSSEYVEVVDERIFNALTSEDPEQLKDRLVFFKKLVEKVRGMDEFSRSEMFEFIISKGGEEFRNILGFGSTLDSLPKDLFKVPFELRGPRTINGGSYGNHLVKYFAHKETGEVVNHLPMSARAADYYPTYYSNVQNMREVMFDLCQRMYHYGRYLMRLIDRGYSFPELVDGDVLKLEEVCHPNILSKKTDGDNNVAVRNNVEIDLGKGSRIIVLSGPNGKAGKTSLLDTIALTIPQAQSGAPVPGRVSLPQEHMFDQVLILPNVRAQTGGNESAMEGRAQVVLKDFVGRVKKLAERNVNGKPLKVFIGMDEIMMGVTNPTDGMVIECNLLEELMTTDGVDVFITLISPDKRVITSMQNRFPGKVDLYGPDPNTPQDHQLVRVDHPAESSPNRVLEERELGRFVNRKDWMVGL